MKFSAITQKDLDFVEILFSFKDVEFDHTVLSETEHLVYSEALQAGCGNLSRQKLLHELTKLGVELDVTSYQEITTWTISVVSSKLPKVLTLLRQMLTAPTFEAKEIKRIKSQLVQELTLRNENARYQANRNFSTSLFNQSDPRYVFSHTDMTAVIDSITPTHIHKLHRERLQCELSVTVGGTQKNCHEVKSFFEKLSIHTARQPNRSKQPQYSKIHTHRLFTFLDLPSKHNIEFTLGNGLPLTYKDVDYPAFVFGLVVLGLRGGFAGRLMSTVREKEGLTYGIYAETLYCTKTDSGVWQITTFFAPALAVQGLTSTFREIDTLASKGISENELLRFKMILSTRETLINDSIQKKLLQAHTLMIRDISEGEFTEYKKLLQKLSIKEVNTALRKYLSSKSLVVSGAGPLKTIQNTLIKSFMVEG